MQKTPGLGDPREFLKGLKDKLPTDSPMSNKVNNLEKHVSNNSNDIGELRNRLGFLENQFYRKKPRTKKLGFFGGGRKRKIFNTSRGPFSSSPLSRIGNPLRPSMTTKIKRAVGFRTGPFGGKRKKTRKQKRKSRTRRRR